jgi:hypothetical protein
MARRSAVATIASGGETNETRLHDRLGSQKDVIDKKSIFIQLYHGCMAQWRPRRMKTPDREAGGGAESRGTL